MKVAIIPARGGSKRIPRKNVRDFCGQPMIAWTIAAARSTGLFQHILVSTDDSEIAEIARRFGAEVPFVRPPELSDDTASTDAVLLHSVGECRRLYGELHAGCCIYPTNPFLLPDDLRRGLALLESERASSAFPVVRYDFPIEQAFVLDGVRPRARWPELLDARSQDLPQHYHDAGAFYWFEGERFSREGKLFGEGAVAFEIASERCQDINVPEDWVAAEIKFRVLKELGRL